jgi:hypothetical protein
MEIHARDEKPYRRVQLRDRVETEVPGEAIEPP